MNLIHVGLHKCGSTFLQGEIIPKLKYDFRIQFLNNFYLIDEFDYIMQCPNPYYDPTVESKIRSIIANKTQHIIEGFSGTGLNMGNGAMIESIAIRQEFFKKIFNNY